jgi:hypothetical protein
MRRLSGFTICLGELAVGRHECQPYIYFSAAVLRRFRLRFESNQRPIRVEHSQVITPGKAVLPLRAGFVVRSCMKD